MKFLVDENLSEALLPGLLDVAPGSIHVRLIGAGGSSGIAPQGKSSTSLLPSARRSSLLGACQHFAFLRSA